MDYPIWPIDQIWVGYKTIVRPGSPLRSPQPTSTSLHASHLVENSAAKKPLLPDDLCQRFTRDRFTLHHITRLQPDRIQLKLSYCWLSCPHGRYDLTPSPYAQLWRSRLTKCPRSPVPCRSRCHWTGARAHRRGSVQYFTTFWPWTLSLGMERSVNVLWFIIQIAEHRISRMKQSSMRSFQGSYSRLPMA